LFAVHGQPWGTRELIVSLAANLACNTYGSEALGQMIEPLLQQAIREQGYTLLPPQPHPVVINTKGPSASGKSTLRPLQKRLAGAIGVPWSDFALISPDIWRKQLLDYASLGKDYRRPAANGGLRHQRHHPCVGRIPPAGHRALRASQRRSPDTRIPVSRPRLSRAPTQSAVSEAVYQRIPRSDFRRPGERPDLPAHDQWTAGSRRP